MEHEAGTEKSTQEAYDLLATLTEAAETAARAFKAAKDEGPDSALPLMRHAATEIRAAIPTLEKLTADDSPVARVLSGGIQRATALADSLEHEIQRWERVAPYLCEMQILQKQLEKAIADHKDVEARVVAETPPTVHEGISVKCDASGVVVTLAIDPAALARLPWADLGRAIVRALQMAEDDMRAKLASAIGVPESNRTPSDGSGLIETFQGGELMVAVDNQARPVVVEIGPQAASWDIEILATRVTNLVRLAQLRARQEMFRPMNDAAIRYGGSPYFGPTSDDITACQAALAHA